MRSLPLRYIFLCNWDLYRKNIGSNAKAPVLPIAKLVLSTVRGEVTSSTISWFAIHY